MKIKSFPFPTFEEWVKSNKEIRVDVGEYRCEIRAFSWTSGKLKVNYKFAVSLSNENPLNIFTPHSFFCESFEYTGDNEKLEQWYYDTIKEFDDFWKNYIKSTYLEED